MESIWSKSCQIGEREALRGDLHCDVAVIGAGMAGVLTAYQLQQAGYRVAVLEAKRIASGQTRNTTAKITSQHGLKYAGLLSSLGLAGARAYAEANEAAIREYRRIIEEKGIDCELESCDAYVYGDALPALKREAEAAAKLGLPASFLEKPDGPIPCKGAVRFTGQAQFHPLKFLRAVSEGLTIFEHTPAQAVDGGTVTTPQGRVLAEKVVFACHYPFPRFAGLYFTRLHQERSYVLALENAGPRDGMWIGSGNQVFSFRRYGELLLLGGGEHRTGENRAGGQYALLRKKAWELFPGSREVAHWSAQDCVTPDGIPLIGQFSGSRPNWYLASGFQKWGMSSSMAAARLLTGLIQGETPPEAPVFDPGRPGAGVLAGLRCEASHAAKGLGKSLFSIPKSGVEQLLPGHGGVVRLKGRKLGVYREMDGSIVAVDIRCPHLGCQLEWNHDERSWDCPCHGSRFDRYGHLISGPAQADLRRME